MTEPVVDRDLYVLGDASQHVGFLNCERISERRHIHGWRVAPHFHEGLAQLFFFAEGTVQGQLDYEPAMIEGPAAIWMPALVSHGFNYPPEMEGWVITVPSADMQRAVAAMPWLGGWILRPASLRGETQAPRLERLRSLFRDIETEHRLQGEDRTIALEALLRLVLIEIHRGIGQDHGAGGSISDRRFDLVRRFQDLVDRDRGRQRPVGAYAEELAVTPTHLARVVRALTGKTPGEVVHDRLVLEARRLIVFTNLPVAEIAYRLNFSTPTYFTRFFAARTGERPTDFRRRMQVQMA